MPNQTHSTPLPTCRMQVESWSESGRITIISTGDRLTTAGIAAVLSTMGTYYAGLTAAQKAALAASVFLTPYSLAAVVQPADVATVAASLTTNIRTAGNTAVNNP